MERAADLPRVRECAPPPVLLLNSLLYHGTLGHQGSSLVSRGMGLITNSFKLPKIVDQQTTRTLEKINKQPNIIIFFFALFTHGIK